MEDYVSNNLTELEFDEDYHLIPMPETLISIETEGYRTLKPRTDYTQPSDRKVLFALGLISMLLLFSGIQLQRAFNRSPHRLEFISFSEIFILNHKQLATNSQKDLNYQGNQQQLEQLWIKNAIAHIKF